MIESRGTPIEIYKWIFTPFNYINTISTIILIIKQFLKWTSKNISEEIDSSNREMGSSWYSFSVLGIASNMSLSVPNFQELSSIYSRWRVALLKASQSQMLGLILLEAVTLWDPILPLFTIERIYWKITMIIEACSQTICMWTILVERWRRHRFGSYTTMMEMMMVDERGNNQLGRRQCRRWIFLT